MVPMGTLPRLSPRLDDPHSSGHNITIPPPSRLLLLLALDARHLPPVHLLPALHGRARHGPSGLQRQHGHQQHRRRRPPAGARGLLRHLHQPRRRLVDLQQQRHLAGDAGERRPGPAQPDLAGEPVQGHDCLSLLDHHSNNLRLHLPPPPRHFSRLARRRGLGRQRTRGEALPLPTRVADSARDHLHSQHLRPRLRPVAAHGLGGGEHHSPGLRQRQRAERGRDQRHGHGVVQLQPADHRDYWAVGHDTEYSGVGADYGLSNTPEDWCSAGGVFVESFV